MDNLDSLASWISFELTKFLSTDSNEDMARYILSMDDFHDIEEYVTDLLGSSDEVKRFTSKLILRLEQSNCFTSTHNSSEDKYNNQLKTGQKTFKDNEGIIMKKKSVYVPLFSSAGEQRTAAILPGRHECECQAMKHALINNCLGCGRVVCQQEGSGPCIFCNNLVCTTEEMLKLSRESKKSDRFREKLLSQTCMTSTDPLAKALQHKNRLLEYDRTSAKRTQVIDDESDYFASDANQWLNDRDKATLRNREEELRSQRYASRLDRRIVLDFAGRRTVEDTGVVDVYNPKDLTVQEINFGKKNQENINKSNYETTSESLTSTPLFISGIKTGDDSTRMRTTHGRISNDQIKVQDRELQQMSDRGMALSMHQPWASLLVAGIKRHEGRTWYTAHRGVLWIAATSKPASPHDVQSVEHQYRSVYGDGIKLPDEYPTACLLGCVHVTDCLAQHEYNQQFADGESSSPYVLICENPRQLIVRFPIKGRHKIYKLEEKLHSAARKGLEKISHQ